MFDSCKLVWTSWAAFPRSHVKTSENQLLVSFKWLPRRINKPLTQTRRYRRVCGKGWVTDGWGGVNDWGVPEGVFRWRWGEGVFRWRWGRATVSVRALTSVMVLGPVVLPVCVQARVC